MGPNEPTADLGASTPVPEQKKPTLKEIKEWRARFWTQRRDVVTKCGHKIDLRHAPTHANCYDCWEAYFSLGFTPEQMQIIHNVLTTHGTKALIALEGKKFTKMFGEFLRRQLLQHASPEVQAASGIEGSQLPAPQIEVQSLEELGNAS